MQADKEDLLRDALWNEIQIKFQLKEEGHILPYFLFRERIATSEYPRKTILPLPYDLIGEFILAECQIMIFYDKTVKVNGLTFSAKALHGHVYRNILEDWWFQTQRLFDYSDKQWEAKFKSLISLAKNQIPVAHRHPIHDSYLRLNAYQLVNQAFDAEATGECGDEFVLTEAAWVTPTREEEEGRHIKAYHQMMQENAKITEEELEEYLMHHLDDIEYGLRMINRQVLIGEGRLDLLARDSEGRDVIIEVKVEKDTDLIWQRMYYESEWTKKHSSPRIIIVTSKPLDDSIKEMLERVGETLVIEVTPYVQNKKIQRLREDRRYVLSPNPLLQFPPLE